MLILCLAEKPPKRVKRQVTELEVEEPEAAKRPPSPSRNPESTVIHVFNLVRPFTLNQLKELLSRTGKLVEDTFWIDKIKSHCFVQVGDFVQLFYNDII